MKLVDSHHHIWIPEQTSPDLGYGWLRDIGSQKPFGDPTDIQRDYTWQEYIDESKSHDVQSSVYVQCDGAIANPVAETEWVQSVIDRNPATVGIVGLVNLSGKDAQTHLEAQTRFASFKGVRQILSFLDDKPELCFSAEHLLRNPQWTDQFALIGEHGLSFDLQLYPEQMHEAAAFLSRHPQVPVIIDHAGSPYDQTSSGLASWQQGLSELAQLPNVSVKLSGFGMFDRQWTAESIMPLVIFILEKFGSQRVMFGSNFPVDKLMASYDDTVERVFDCVKHAGDNVINDVFGRTAQRIYGLELIST